MERIDRSKVYQLLDNPPEDGVKKLAILQKAGVWGMATTRTLVYELPEPKTLFVWMGTDLLRKDGLLELDTKAFGYSEIRSHARWLGKYFPFWDQIKLAEEDMVKEMGLVPGFISPLDFVGLDPRQHGFSWGIILASELASELIAGRGFHPDLIIPKGQHGVEITPIEHFAFERLGKNLGEAWTLYI